MDITKQNLTSYLLGELPEADQSALEERYFNDPQMFEQLVETENDLVDRHARNQLPADLRVRFELQYLNNPHRRERLKLAQAITSRLDQRKVADGAPARVEPRRSEVSWWQRATAGLSPALRYSLAFASLLLVLFAAWLLVGNWRRQRAAAESQAAAQRERDRAEQERNRIPEVAKGPEVAQPTPQPSPQPSPAPVTSPEVGPSSVTLALTFGGVRGGGGGGAASVKLAPSTTKLRLVLNLDANEYPSYQVSLRTSNGTSVLAQTGLKPRSVNGRGQLVFSAPAARLNSGEYVVTVSGVDTNGEIDDLGRTLFRVDRK